MYKCKAYRWSNKARSHQILWLGSNKWIFQIGFPAWQCKFPRPPFLRGRCTLTSCCVWRRRWRAGCWPMAVRWSPTWPAERETRCTVVQGLLFRLLWESATRESAPSRTPEQLRHYNVTNKLYSLIFVWTFCSIQCIRAYAQSTIRKIYYRWLKGGIWQWPPLT